VGKHLAFSKRRLHHGGTEDTEVGRVLKTDMTVETNPMHGEEQKSFSIGLVDEDLTGEIIGAAMSVHRELGPGLLESAYEVSMGRELTLREIPFQSQVEVPVEYKGVRLDCGYRIDLLVANRVVVELKSVEHLQLVHEAQLMTYLRLSGVRVGLLINFNVPALRRGIVRRIL
jgi:GxxExxY protein